MTSGGYNLFHYEPSGIAAGIFIGIFGLSALVHGWQMIRSRTWYFIPMCIACILEAVGYFGRILASKNPTSIFPYILQSILLLVAPAIYAASIYVILGRLIVLVDAEEYSIVRINWLTKIFVTGDILSFFAQAGGGALFGAAKGDPKKLKNAQWTILGGLGIQILFFAVFIVVILLFHSRIHKTPTHSSKALLRDPPSRYTWKTMLYVLYAASALIMVRSLFRVVEYIMGHDGFLMQNEAWLYVFDAVLMSIVSCLFNVVHPSRVLIRAGHGDYEMSRNMA